MPFAAAIPLAISGISALAGLFGNRKSQAEQKSISDRTATTDINQLTAPEYDEQTRGMRDTLMQHYLGQLGDNSDFFGGYAREGLNTINQGSDAAQRAIDNILASRGLSGTSAGITSSISNQLGRVGQQSSFLNQIPLLADQRYQNILGAASGFFKGLPVGTRQTGHNVTSEHTEGTGTATQPGNMLGGMLGSLATSLGGLFGQGAFKTKPTTPTSGIGYVPPVDYQIVPPGYQLPGTGR